MKMALGLGKDMVPTYIVHEKFLGIGKDMVTEALLPQGQPFNMAPLLTGNYTGREN